MAIFDEARKMESNQKPRADGDATASGVSVRESQESKAPKTLALDEEDLKAADRDQGSDPYNTSGGFDRTKNWTRVGKR